MAESADQASDTQPPPNDQPTSTSENPTILGKSASTTAGGGAPWADVSNAMQSAENAVAKAAQGMADRQGSLTPDNHK